MIFTGSFCVIVLLRFEFWAHLYPVLFWCFFLSVFDGYFLSLLLPQPFWILEISQISPVSFYLPRVHVFVSPLHLFISSSVSAPQSVLLSSCYPGWLLSSVFCLVFFLLILGCPFATSFISFCLLVPAYCFKGHFLFYFIFKVCVFAFGSFL